MYQALYRKYRPLDFDSVVGQNAVVQTLRNSIINHKFTHAYMFFGPRGIGKTTISKIFARNINCLNPNNGLACGKCDNCKVSFSKECVDILEIDAASNNGVDEIRELKSKINLVPSELKYKVYIIDEVHMLTDSSFNALLKTLEEPPEHAIFILATTDAYKVPETITSRCQCFSFKRIPNSVIVDRLKFVCEKEKISVSDDILSSIASLSDGGMRDALGLLDKLVSYSDHDITMETFVELNGIASSEQLSYFLNHILNANISEVLNFIHSFENDGKNLIQILNQLLEYGRNLLVDYYLNNKLYDFSIDVLQDFTNQLNEKMFDIKKSSNTRVYIEMFLLKFMNDSILKSENRNIHLNSSTIEVSAIPDNNSQKDTSSNTNVNSNSSPSPSSSSTFPSIDTSNIGDDSDDFESDSSFLLTDGDLSSPKILNISDIMKARINNTFARADKKLLREESLKFDLLKDFTFDQEIGYIVCSLLDSTIRVVSQENILISFEFESIVNQNLLILDKITDVYHRITNSDKQFAIVSDTEWERLKNEYISNLKNGIKYEIISEPNPVLEELNKDDIISNSAVELFGDIVEVE